MVYRVRSRSTKATYIVRPCFRTNNNRNVFPIETVQTNDWFSMLSSLDVYLGTGVTLLEHTYCFYKTSPVQKFKMVVNITKEKSVLFLAHTCCPEQSSLSPTKLFLLLLFYLHILCMVRYLHVQELCFFHPHTKHLQSSIKLFLSGPWFNYSTRL